MSASDAESRSEELRGWGKLALETIGIVATLVLLLHGLEQYRDAQQWRASELADRQLSQMVDDPLLKLGLQIIDWPARKLTPPSAYRSLLDQDGTFNHSWPKMNAAVEGASGWTDGEFGSLEMVMYVDAIERVFFFFDEVEYQLSVGLIDERDVAPLRYWVSRTMTHEALTRHAAAWDYPGLAGLAARFGLVGEQPDGA